MLSPQQPEQSVMVSRCRRGWCTRTADGAVVLHTHQADAVSTAVLWIDLQSSRWTIRFEEPCALFGLGCPLDGSFPRAGGWHSIAAGHTA